MPWLGCSVSHHDGLTHSLRFDLVWCRNSSIYSYFYSLFCSSPNPEHLQDWSEVSESDDFQPKTLILGTYGAYIVSEENFHPKLGGRSGVRRHDMLNHFAIRAWRLDVDSWPHSIQIGKFSLEFCIMMIFEKRKGFYLCTQCFWFRAKTFRKIKEVRDDEKAGSVGFWPGSIQTWGEGIFENNLILQPYLFAFAKTLILAADWKIRRSRKRRHPGRRFCGWHVDRHIGLSYPPKTNPAVNVWGFYLHVPNVRRTCF